MSSGIFFNTKQPWRSLVESNTFKGMRVYTKRVLSNYDLIVLKISNPFIWRCPTRHLLTLYNENISSCHLDIGVGTGFFLKHCRFPSIAPHITLLDLNENCLGAAKKRIESLHPKTLKANVLEPFDTTGEKFASVALNYLFHCLHGPILQKADSVFTHIKPHLEPGAKVFGATITNQSQKLNPMSKKLSGFYNSKGIFSNTEDTVDDLKLVLDRHFIKTSVREFGCVALFRGENQG